MIFDGHSDIFTDVTVRRLKGETQVLKNHHLPRLRKGNIEGGCFVLWIDPPYDADPAKRLGELMHCIKDEMAECEEAVVVKNLKEIEEARKAGKFYILPGLEGLSGIGTDLDRLMSCMISAAVMQCFPGTNRTICLQGRRATPTEG